MYMRQLRTIQGLGASHHEIILGYHRPPVARSPTSLTSPRPSKASVTHSFVVVDGHGIHSHPSHYIHHRPPSIPTTPTAERAPQSPSAPPPPSAPDLRLSGSAQLSIALVDIERALSPLLSHANPSITGHDARPTGRRAGRRDSEKRGMWRLQKWNMYRSGA